MHTLRGHHRRRAVVLALLVLVAGSAYGIDDWPGVFEQIATQFAS